MWNGFNRITMMRRCVAVEKKGGFRVRGWLFVRFSQSPTNLFLVRMAFREDEPYGGLARVLAPMNHVTRGG